MSKGLIYVFTISHDFIFYKPLACSLLIAGMQSINIVANQNKGFTLVVHPLNNITILNNKHHPELINIALVISSRKLLFLE